MVTWPHVLGQNIMVVGVLVEGLYLMVDRKQRDETLTRPHTRHKPLPPARPHLLKFTQPPKMVPPAGAKYSFSP
jgi:hypothetical protein